LIISWFCNIIVLFESLGKYLKTMNPTYSTRQTLLQKAQKKSDPEAWEQLIGFYRKYIYVIIRSMGVNEGDADDVLQLTTVELWKYLPKYEYDSQKAKFRSWVAKITRNQVISFARRQNAYIHKLDIAQAELQGDCLKSIQTLDLDDIITKEWETFVANSAMQNISRHFSEKALRAFDLFSKGMTVNDISDVLAVKADSIYKYISRIKLKLIEEIQNLQKDLDF
jgi:RNA polymerase sigma factor (sigma-70 family)